jgi:hypothetical protein
VAVCHILDLIIAGFGFDTVFKNDHYQCAAHLHFGNITADYHNHIPYVYEDINAGSCFLVNIPESIRPVFERSKAANITSKDNPNIMSFFRRLFFSKDDIKLGDRGVEYVDVSTDPNIQDLFADEEFQALNASWGKEEFTMGQDS